MYGLILTLILIILFIRIEKEDNALCLLICLLPLHGFIKFYLDSINSGGDYFAIWKELAIIILLIKQSQIKRISYLTYKIKLFTFILFALALTYTILSSAPLSLALASLKNYFFPFLTLYLGANIIIKPKSVNKILLSFIFIIVFVNLSGYYEHFFKREYFLKILGGINQYGSDGNILYTSSSWTINETIRMFGIMGGGPNQFGVFNGICTSILFGLFIAKAHFISKKLLIIVFLFSLSGLIFSLSRAGLGILAISSFIIVYNQKAKRSIKVLLVLLIIIALVYVIFSIYFPSVISIINDTLNGKEASSSDRGNNVIKGLLYIVDNPLGSGLGSSSLSFKSNAYFAESAIDNLAIEIGILGTMIYLYLQALIIKQLSRKHTQISYIALALSLSCLIISVFSINPYQMPSNYYWFLFVGLGLNNTLTKSYNILTRC